MLATPRQIAGKLLCIFTLQSCATYIARLCIVILHLTSEGVVQDEELEKAENIEAFAEYETLAIYTGVKNYTVNVIEDNEQKRIIQLENNEGQPQYKSIYLHKQKVLKIIDLRGGLLFEGGI